ncbi:MAG TPA: nickel insertion protein, partial [Burkholderiales bacterium]|nr:nickel insertion protein [Burkholderiales bacterium]
MKILYLDAFAGISGDMMLGALLALGLPLHELEQELARLPLHGYSITATPRQISGISAIKFDVRIDQSGHTHRTFREIRAMLDKSPLTPAVKCLAIDIFTRLAQAEGRIHSMQPDDVTFHELGAVDSVVDIVGTAVGLNWLAAERVYV